MQTLPSVTILSVAEFFFIIDNSISYNCTPHFTKVDKTFLSVFNLSTNFSKRYFSFDSSRFLIISSTLNVIFSFVQVSFGFFKLFIRIFIDNFSKLFSVFDFEVILIYVLACHLLSAKKENLVSNFDEAIKVYIIMI